MVSPAASALSWTGFYLGANGGYGWSQFHDPFIVTNNVGGSTLPFTNINPKGAFGGLQGGYNWQTGMFVFGVEGDIQAANIHDSNHATDPANFVDHSRTINWFGTVRGRLGVTFNQVLVYGTGGWAFAHANRSNVVNGVAQMESNAFENGFAVGGGVEYAFDRHWSVKGEYQYIGLRSYTPSGPVTGAPTIIVTAQPQNDSFHTVRVGLNYKF